MQLANPLQITGSSTFTARISRVEFFSSSRVATSKSFRTDIKAAELVVEHRNSINGVNGRKIELIVEDDVCKPEVATNTATKVVGEKVHAVLGHICSGATKAALGIFRFDARGDAIGVGFSMYQVQNGVYVELG